jgi:hypothetical protein
MAVTSRVELIDYCLRNLGAPVIEINIDEEQISDRIDESLQFFQENIEEGMEKVFLQHVVTATDVTNGWIPAIDLIANVIRVFPTGGLYSSSIFNQEFRLRIADLTAFNGLSILDYYITEANFSILENLLSVERRFEFNRVKNELRIIAAWGRDIIEGSTLVIEAYRFIDPQAYTEVYNHPFLKKYATALIKRAWGNNLKKFSGVQLPGGITLNGQVIYDEAVTELKELELEVLDKWQLPPAGLVG